MPPPGARGRLIFPFLVELAQLDTAAIAADPGAGVPVASGYDPDFREPVKVAPAASAQVGVSARKETAPITVRAQIEPDQQERLSMMLSGNSPNSRFGIVLHYKELERAGLLDSNGRPLIRKNDRLVRILTTAGALVEVIPNPPGLFVVEVQSMGFGPGGMRNLLLLVFEEREQSVATAAG